MTKWILKRIEKVVDAQLDRWYYKRSRNFKNIDVDTSTKLIEKVVDK